MNKCKHYLSILIIFAGIFYTSTVFSEEINETSPSLFGAEIGASANFGMPALLGKFSFGADIDDQKVEIIFSQTLGLYSSSDIGGKYYFFNKGLFEPNIGIKFGASYPWDFKAVIPLVAVGIGNYFKITDKFGINLSLYIGLPSTFSPEIGAKFSL
jgi:hypothetical protein